MEAKVELTKKDALSAVETAKSLLQQLANKRETLREDMPSKELSSLLSLYEKGNEILSLTGQKSQIAFMLDTQNQDILAIQAQLTQLGSQIDAETSWFYATLCRWSEESLRGHAENLPRYSGWIKGIIKNAKHMLSEEQEKVLALKEATGIHAVTKLYSMLTTDFVYEVTVDGQTKTYNQAELRPLFRNKKREVRKAAAEALIIPYTEKQAILGQMYQNVITSWQMEVLMRKYESPIAVQHLWNDISAKTYEALFRTVQKNLHLFQEYIEIKRKLLEYEEFTRYDFSAPIEGLPEGIDFDQAKDRVLTIFGDFADWMQEAAKAVFINEQIDSHPRESKRSGACCYGMIPGEIPFVMTNYTNTFDDVMTLAHELGHAVHFTESGKQSALSYDAPLVLAESASNFAELLLFHDYYKKGTDKEKIALLCMKLDDLLGSIVTQMRYTMFEERAFEKLSQGETMGELDKLWSDLLKQHFPSVEWPETSVLWRVIPHIYHSPFYCYSYAFGALLVLALWKKGETDPEFPTLLRELLSLGGSLPPEEALQKLGFDITTEAFWQTGFDVIKEYLVDLNRLI